LNNKADNYGILEKKLFPGILIAEDINNSLGCFIKWYWQFCLCLTAVLTSKEYYENVSCIYLPLQLHKKDGQWFVDYW